MKETGGKMDKYEAFLKDLESAKFEHIADCVSEFIKNELDEVTKVIVITNAMAIFVTRLQEKIAIQDTTVPVVKEMCLRALHPEIGSNMFAIMNLGFMLSPNAEPYYRTIESYVFDALQRDAKLLLEEGKGSDEQKAHWQSVVDGNVPFGFRIRE